MAEYWCLRRLERDSLANRRCLYYTWLIHTSNAISTCKVGFLFVYDYKIFAIYSFYASLELTWSHLAVMLAKFNFFEATLATFSARLWKPAATTNIAKGSGCNAKIPILNCPKSIKIRRWHWASKKWRIGELSFSCWNEDYPGQKSKSDFNLDPLNFLLASLYICIEIARVGWWWIGARLRVMFCIFTGSHRKHDSKNSG